MKNIAKKYRNDKITIVWKPGLCIHSTLCWKGNTGLMKVFNPTKKPWIDPKGAETERIVERIKNCPSGALSFYENNTENIREEMNNENVVEPIENGPLMIYGNLIVKDKAGNQIQKDNVTAFCRCGASSNKPFCDGTHNKIGFVG